ncbi:MAG: hypothetical protein ACXQTY_04600 [Candidatus Methanogasteraceae archaeon]
MGKRTIILNPDCACRHEAAEPENRITQSPANTGRHTIPEVR